MGRGHCCRGLPFRCIFIGLAALPVAGSTIPRFIVSLALLSAALGCLCPGNLLWAKDQVLDSWQAEAELATDGRQQGMRTWGNWCWWNGAWCQDRVTGPTVRIPVGQQVEGGCFLETWVVTAPSKNQYYQSFPGPSSTCHHRVGLPLSA